MLGWFRKRGDGEAAGQVDQEIAALDKEARQATDQARGNLFNRCGDLCAAARKPNQAVRYYGEAVDAYLSTGYVGPAAAMCRKILRIAPDSVRTHLTLACLAAHEGQLDEARREVDRFVEASLSTRTEKLAVSRLRLMGAAIVEVELKQHIADRLGDLGDDLGKARIESMLRGEVPDESLTPGTWERLLKAASADPDELWKFG